MLRNIRQLVFYVWETLRIICILSHRYKSQFNVAFRFMVNSKNHGWKRFRKAMPFVYVDHVTKWREISGNF